MSYRYYPPAGPLLIGYDPFRDLPADHLARLVEQVVEETVTGPPPPPGPGQPPFDPRLTLKVLVYGYATGTRSSRQLERLCAESLPYLFLTRGDTPSFKTLCTVRLEQTALLEQVWLGLFSVAKALKLERLGHIVVDSTKLRADASPEAVVKAKEYEVLRAELARILEEARQVDEREAAEGQSGTTRLGQSVEREQMRDILRRVRQQLAAENRAAKKTLGAVAERPALAPSPSEGPAAGGAGSESAAPPPPATPAARPPLGQRMRQRCEAALAALAAAAGQEHLCLTDPEARMMGGGRERKVRECHSFEVAVDREAGLLVAAQVSQDASDNARLEAVVAAAQVHEPGGVRAVDGDSGFYSGGAIGRLQAAGIDTCVPDSNTAGDLHRGQPAGTVRDTGRGQIRFTYEPALDLYRCPEGNELVYSQASEQGGQQVTQYKAKRDCRDCPLAGQCLTQAKARHRTLKVGEYQTVLEAARQRFNEPEHQERYRHRGEVVETVFGFVRGTLGYTRWQLRGKEKVDKEGRLLALAYQLRKVHGAWAAA
jgi:transposase